MLRPIGVLTNNNEQQGGHGDRRSSCVTIADDGRYYLDDQSYYRILNFGYNELAVLLGNAIITLPKPDWAVSKTIEHVTELLMAEADTTTSFHHKILMESSTKKKKKMKKKNSTLPIPLSNNGYSKNKYKRHTLFSIPSCSDDDEEGYDTEGMTTTTSIATGSLYTTTQNNNKDEMDIECSYK